MLSTKPADFGEGGAIVQDTDARITKARYILSTERPEYHKSIRPRPGQTVAAIQTMATITVIPYDADGEGKEEEILYSLGESSRIIPINGGLHIDKAPGAPEDTKVVKTSNFAQFCASWDMIDPTCDREGPAGISILEGYSVHLLRVEQKERKGMVVMNVPGQAAKRPPSVVLVTKVYGKNVQGHAPVAGTPTASAPAPTAAPIASQAATPTATPAAAAPAGNGLDVGALQEVLLELVANGPVPKKNLATLAFKPINTRWPDAASRNAYLKLLVNDDFLKNSPVQYDGVTIAGL